MTKVNIYQQLWHKQSLKCIQELRKYFKQLIYFLNARDLLNTASRVNAETKNM